MSKAIIKKAPESLKDIPEDYLSVFLAGSIDMGKAEEWQTKLTKEITKKFKKIAVLNPRRDDWDSSWEQSIDNEKFREQVEWELSSMELADIVVFYFDKNGEAPITLMELGLNAERKKKIIVCCPDGFWKKGNVDVLCDYYDLPLVTSFEELVEALCG